MISPISWTKVPRVPAVWQRVTTPESVLPIAATESLMCLRDEVRDRGLGPDGRLFIRFLRFDTRRDEVHFEAGVPTCEPLFDREPIGTRWGDMLGGFAATTRHIGTYDSMPAAIRLLGEWIAARGGMPIGKPYQFYGRSPEDSFDRNIWDTELIWFARRPAEWRWRPLQPVEYPCNGWVASGYSPTDPKDAVR